MSEDPFQYWEGGREEFLRQFGRVWFAEPEPETYEAIVAEARRTAIDEAQAALLGKPPRSVVLVGEEGVGKSVVIRASARRLHDAGWTVFESSAAEILSGMRYIGELEERVQLLLQASASRPLLWVLPDPTTRSAPGRIANAREASWTCFSPTSSVDHSSSSPRLNRPPGALSPKLDRASLRCSCKFVSNR